MKWEVVWVGGAGRFFFPPFLKRGFLYPREFSFLWEMSDPPGGLEYSGFFKTPQVKENDKFNFLELSRGNFPKDSLKKKKKKPWRVFFKTRKKKFLGRRGSPPPPASPFFKKGGRRFLSRKAE